MTLRRILLHPDARLRKTAEPVADVSDGLRSLADDMLETMYDAPGIGLAGPQIGVNKRLFVMDCADKDDPPEPMVLLNPVILAASDETNIHEEGCLSIPEHYADVTRPAMVQVRWLGLDGAEHEAEFDGLRATCFQHELDHLDGKLFIDYLGAVKRAMITQKMKKLKKARA